MNGIRVRFSQQSYEECLQEARAMHSDIAERFLALGAVLVDMLQHRSTEQVADDVECDVVTVRNFSLVAAFWGAVRIGPSPTGRRPVYALYNRVVYDPLLSGDDRQEIKRNARRGRHIVEEMLDGMRERAARQVAIDYARGNSVEPRVVTSARAALRPAPGEQPGAHAVLLALRSVVDRAVALESADDDQIAQMETMGAELQGHARLLRNAR